MRRSLAISAGGEARREGARDDELAALHLGGVALAGRAVEHIDHGAGIEAERLAHHQRLAHRHEAGRREIVVQRLQRMARAGRDRTA